MEERLSAGTDEIGVPEAERPALRRYAAAGGLDGDHQGKGGKDAKINAIREKINVSRVTEELLLG
jgi:hypothetical protein